jgi:hypothetical protein
MEKQILEAIVIDEVTKESIKQLPKQDKEILYSYLFDGKITPEEFLFLCKKKIEGHIGG